MAMDQPGKFDKIVRSNCSNAYVFVSGLGPQYEGTAGQDRRTLGGWRLWHLRQFLKTYSPVPGLPAVGGCPLSASSGATLCDLWH